jgi:hypothetical protein
MNFSHRKRISLEIVFAQESCSEAILSFKYRTCTTCLYLLDNNIESRIYVFLGMCQLVTFFFDRALVMKKQGFPNESPVFFFSLRNPVKKT